MVHMNTGERFIFVGGPPRSGTTLVQNMLDSHPDICGGPEFLHLPDIIDLRRKLYGSIKKEWIDLFCSYEDVDNLLRFLIERFLIPLAEKQGCAFLSEKTPGNILIFTELMDLFPGARFISVIRDPRAIIASLLKVGKRGKAEGWKTQDFTHSVPGAINYVRKCFNAGFSASRAAPDRLLTVVYEKLVNDPEGESKRICSFLEIDWLRQMIHPGRIRHLGEKAITNNVWYNLEMYGRDPETTEVDKWKTQLTPIQEVVISKAFRNNVELLQFGYDFSANGYSGPIYNLLAALSSLVRLRDRVARIFLQ